MGVLEVALEAGVSTPGPGIAKLYVDTADGRCKVRMPDGQDYVLNMSGFDKNVLINGGFDFWQRQDPATLTARGTSATARVMTADRWGLTSSAVGLSCVRVDTISAPETGLASRFYGRYQRLSAVGKHALSQVVEAYPTATLRGRKVRLQAKMRRAVASAMTIRLGLVQNNSSATADAIAATFISAFNGSGVDPTLGTNLAYIAPDSGSAVGGTIVGSGVSCALTGGWINYSAVFTVPSNCKNLIALLWADSNLAVNDEHLVGEVGLFDGPDIVDWVPPSYQWEKDRCERFCEKTLPIDTNPVTNAGVTTGCLRGVLGKAAATALAAQLQWRYRVEKRAAGGITLLNPGAANAQIRQIGGTAGDLTASTAANATVQSVDFTGTGIATGAVGDQVGLHAICDAEI